MPYVANVRVVRPSHVVVTIRVHRLLAAALKWLVFCGIGAVIGIVAARLWDAVWL
jgi:hypothetical protein